MRRGIREEYQACSEYEMNAKHVNLRAASNSNVSGVEKTELIVAACNTQSPTTNPFNNCSAQFERTRLSLQPLYGLNDFQSRRPRSYNRSPWPLTTVNPSSSHMALLKTSSSINRRIHHSRSPVTQHLSKLIAVVHNPRLMAVQATVLGSEDNLVYPVAWESRED